MQRLSSIPCPTTYSGRAEIQLSNQQYGFWEDNFIFLNKSK